MSIKYDAEYDGVLDAFHASIDKDTVSGMRSNRTIVLKRRLEAIIHIQSRLSLEVGNDVDAVVTGRTSESDDMRLGGVRH